MCHECQRSAGWYRAMKRKCDCCGWKLHKSCNDVEFCFYCDWVEPDDKRAERIFNSQGRA